MARSAQNRKEIAEIDRISFNNKWLRYENNSNAFQDTYIHKREFATIRHDAVDF